MMHQMGHGTYMKVATAIFSIVALAHLARALFGIPIAIGTWSVPLWLSWVAFVVAGVLAYKGYKLQG